MKSPPKVVRPNLCDEPASAALASIRPDLGNDVDRLAGSKVPKRVILYKMKITETRRAIGYAELRSELPRRAG